jgi:glutathione synthase/RimK-type ligase-like ATP-grasp enzyme
MSIVAQRLVGLATCREFPELYEDDQPLIPALAQLGIEGVPMVWTDEDVDWSAFDAVVLRNTWDYSDDRDAFLVWIDHVASVTTLLNRADLVHWSTDKRYLRDLAAAGIPVVPTAFVEPGEAAASWAGAGFSAAEIVVKPAVSCGSRSTARHRADDDSDGIEQHIAGLLADNRVVMVQPYLEAVDTYGETALLYFDGVFSHAIRKGPMLVSREGSEWVEGLFLSEQIDPRVPSVQEREVADRVMAAIPGDVPVYARVDLIPTASGAPVLLELELAEPSLFLLQSDDAPGRFAAAIAARIA